MSTSIKDLLQDVVASPLGDIIASVGEGVADAQQALDDASLAKTLEIYASGDDELLGVLREIGYRPTFYALPETTGEVRVSMRLGSGAGSSPAAKKFSTPGVALNMPRVGLNVRGTSRLYATPVDAGYANRYGYQANVSAKLTFKIVPVPPPEGVDELRAIPQLIGQDLAGARGIVEGLGLVLLIQDAEGQPVEEPDEGATISGQTPEAGQGYLQVGEEVRVVVA